MLVSLVLLAICAAKQAKPPKQKTENLRNRMWGGKRVGSLSVSHDVGDDKREQSLVPAFVHLSILVLHLNKDSIKIASPILCRELKVFFFTPHVE